MEKKNIGIVYGGRSTEHEISIKSARNIAEALDSNLYNLLLIAIAKDGSWYLKTKKELLSEDTVTANDQALALIPGPVENKIIILGSSKPIGSIDAIFPIVHGTGGEDGTLQGLFKTLQIPFVGPGVIGSAVCIDKDVAKRLLRDAEIKNSKFLSYNKSERDQIKYEIALAKLGLPMYIKPPNLGSSVGISKVTTKREFSQAIDLAFQFDKKVLIEENIVGRELECAVLGNDEVMASTVGEVVTIGDQHTFYSYDAKYLDANGSKTMIPAEVPEKDILRIRQVAVKTYKALECEGMARVDVFLTESGEIIVNEVNTLPGFTDISMYPKLWDSEGLNYSDLITKLINLAISRSEDEDKKIVDFKL